MGTKAIQVDSLWAGIKDNNNEPLSGGLVYSYEAGTTTPKALYTDRDKTSPATNPVVLDTYGRAEVYGDGLYKLVVHDADDVSLYDMDDMEFVAREGGSLDDIIIGETTPAAAYFTNLTFEDNFIIGNQTIDTVPAANDVVYYDATDLEWKFATTATSNEITGLYLGSNNILLLGTSTGWTGLTPNAKYYLQADGSVSDALATSKFVGVAKTTTTMFNDFITGGGSASSAGSETYVFSDKYLYAPKRFDQFHIVKSAGTIKQLKAYLNVDAGYQFDNMASTTSWAASNADGANLAVDSTNFFEGVSCLTVDKTGTSTTSTGIQRVNFSATNLTGKKVRVAVYVPTISAGTFGQVRIWLGSGGGFTNYKYWDFTTDVDGRTITPAAGWYIVEVDTASSPTSSGGTYDNTNFNSLRAEVIVSDAAATFTGFKVDHVIYTPGSAALNINVYRRTSAGDELIKQNADTYSFGGLTAGEITTKATSLDNPEIQEGDLLFFEIVNTADNYGGQDLTIMVELL